MLDSGQKAYEKMIYDGKEGVNLSTDEEIGIMK